MRIWLDPDRLAAYQLTAGDVVRALQEQNIQVAGGALGQPPAPTDAAFQLTVQTQGRFDRCARSSGSHRQDRRRRAPRARRRRRARRARRPRLRHELVPERQARRGARHLPAPGHATRSPPPRASSRQMNELKRDFPAGHRLPDRLQPDRVHRRVGARGLQDAVRGAGPRRHRRDRLPADLARGDHPDRRDPGVADRHVRGHDARSASRSTS